MSVNQYGSSQSTEDTINNFKQKIETSWSQLPWDSQWELSQNSEFNEGDLLVKKIFILQHLQKSNSQIKAELANTEFTFVPPDYSETPLLLKKIAECRASFKENLTHIEGGKTKGFLFTIQKVDKVVGFIFGTVHHLAFEDKGAEEVPPLILEKLKLCDVLLTEARCEKNETSTEGVLAKIVKKWGIANFGIDSDYPEDSKSSPHPAWESYRIAYIKGDMEAIEQNPLSNPIVGDPERENRRNALMAENIDYHLKNAPQGSLIAVGIGNGHLINTNPQIKTVIQNLKDQGYTVKYTP